MLVGDDAKQLDKIILGKGYVKDYMKMSMNFVHVACYTRGIITVKFPGQKLSSSEASVISLMFSQSITKEMEIMYENIDESKIKGDRLSCPNDLNLIKKDEKWFIDGDASSMSKEERKRAKAELDSDKESQKTFMKAINRFSEKIIKKLKEKNITFKKFNDYFVSEAKKVEKAMRF